MRMLLALVVLFLGIHLTGAEFSISFREASDEPQAGFVEHPYRTNQKIYVGPDSGITAEHIANLSYHNSAGEDFLGVAFTPAGAQLNQAFTTKMLKQRIAIFINQQLVSSARVIAPSIDECWISGPTKAEIEQFIASFKAK